MPNQYFSKVMAMTNINVVTMEKTDRITCVLPIRPEDETPHISKDDETSRQDAFCREEILEYALNRIKFCANNYVRRKMLPQSDRNDAIQDACLMVLKHLPRFEPSLSFSPKTYVSAIVRKHFWFSFLNRRKKQPYFVDIDSLDDSEVSAVNERGKGKLSEVEVVDLRLDLEEIGRRLPPALQDVFRLLPNYNSLEIASLLGIHQSTVSRRIKMIFRLVRKSGLIDLSGLDKDANEARKKQYIQRKPNCVIVSIYEESPILSAIEMRHMLGEEWLRSLAEEIRRILNIPVPKTPEKTRKEILPDQIFQK